MSTLVPYHSMFALDPLFPMFPGEHGLRSLTSDLIPGGFPNGFRVDVEDTEEAYVVTAELAGVAKEDIDVQFEDDRLTIAVEHRESEEKKERNYVHKETREWSASRSVILRGVDAGSVSAKMSDGVLAITLPKAEEEKPETNKVTIE